MSLELEYLKKLREETEKYGIILIFDEIIAGYRFTDSLFQNKLKIIPDLTTMGKIIGGGLPIGAIGGRSDIIESSSPQAKHQVLIGGGTFSGYPLSMLAGLKTIEILKKATPESNIEAFVGDITKRTHIEPSSLDLLYIAAVVHGFSKEKMQDLLAEARRLLKPKALLAIVEIDKKETPFGPPLHIRYSPEELREIVPLAPLETVRAGEHFYMQLFQNQDKQ